MDLVNRLKHYMDRSQITISQFADRCSIPRPTMSQLMNGRNKRISDEVINKIHNAFPNLSILWLMFGEGEMESCANIEISEPQNAENEGISIAPESDYQPFTPAQTPNNTFTNSAATGDSFENTLFDETNLKIQTPPPPCPFPENNQTRENIMFDSSSTMFNATQSKQTPANEIKSISISPDAHKKITNIVVFYSDNSFQSFLPDA